MSRKKKYAALSITVILVLIIISLSINKDGCIKKDHAICKIDIEGNRLKLKVAYSREAQSQGLMWVTDLKDGTGMIFVYDIPQHLSFWMKNTLIPLSIAFVEPDGKISSIFNMYPQPGTPDTELATYPSATMVKYAIEVPLGWFELNNIKRNSYVDIPEQLR
jgi:uncharacterized membrane protein (UPF0127 family)